MRDKDGELAPVAFVPHNFSGGMVEPTEAEQQERERLAAERQTSESLTATETIVGKVSTSEIPPPIVRGFGEDYREFPDEMLTDINVEKLVSYLKNSGPEVCQSLPWFRQAGHRALVGRFHHLLFEPRRRPLSLRLHILLLAGRGQANSHAQREELQSFLHASPACRSPIQLGGRSRSNQADRSLDLRDDD
jgi:hypothetical protein